MLFTENIEFIVKEALRSCLLIEVIDLLFVLVEN